jgi:hypothetical protein
VNRERNLTYFQANRLHFILFPFCKTTFSSILK